jgi:hypothetical protein
VGPFFLAFSLNNCTDAWVRLYLEKRRMWVVSAAVRFSAASLCRFDTWAYIPVLGVPLIDFSGGIKSAWSDRSGWMRAPGFTLASSGGGAAG